MLKQTTNWFLLILSMLRGVRTTGRVWMSFGVSGVRVLRLVFFKPIPGLEAQEFCW